MRTLLRFALLLCAVMAAVRAGAAGEKPNIILILADDLGYGDVGVFHQNARRAAGKQPAFSTPNLDRFAAEGARLTHHYCAAPVCAPSRASLLTGVTQGHANVRDNQFDKALEDNHTLGTVLRRAGYDTAMIGKWGLHGQMEARSDGADPNAPAHPLNRGFDSFFGYLRHVDGHEHYPKEAPYFVGAKRERFGPVKLWDNRTDITASLDRCYSTDLFTARAKKYIVDHQAAAPGRPFFLYLALIAPHVVLELPTQPYPAGGGLRGGMQWLGTPGHMINTAEGKVDSWVHPECVAAAYDDDQDPATPQRPWPDVFRRHETAVHRIDDCVADLLRLLADLHLDEKTLVVFSSDNGPERVSFVSTEPDYSPEFFGSYGPFDGIKRDLWEGGVRVPTMVRWPGRVRAGGAISEPGAQWDWLATFADAGGLPPPARADGVSLLPTLTGRESSLVHAPLYFEYTVAGRTPTYADFEPSRRNRLRGQMQAVRLGDFVGVRYNVKTADDPFEIYNVVTDPKQARNLASDPAQAKTQREMQAAALHSRRPDPSAPRPYDDALVPATVLDARATQAGVNWRAYTGSFPWVPDFSTLKPLASGSASKPDPAQTKHYDATGYHFTGHVIVPADGDYTFYLKTDTGAVMRLHDATLIDADFGYAGGTERSAQIRLKAGPHPCRISSVHRTGSAPLLALEWSGPGFERRAIPDAAFARSTTTDHLGSAKQ